MLLALTGEHEETRGILGSLTFPTPGTANLIGAWTLAVFAAEAVSVLGDADRAGAFYPIVLDALATGSVLRQYDGAVIERIAGMTADTAGLPQKAEEHFERALRQAEELPHVIERPQVRHWYGRFLIVRGGRDDLDRARRLLDEAVNGYRTIGMPRHTEMAQQLLDRAGESR
jgi:hypothetical protein